MSGTNQVTIIGNVGTDVEVKNFQNGGSVANYAVATNQNYTDAAGQRLQKTEWHRIAIFNPGLVRVAQEKLKKGTKVEITGQLETRKWQDQQGNTRYSTEVALRPYAGSLDILPEGSSGSVNEAVIRGNLGQDPDIRQLPNGGRVANLSIAVNDVYRDKQSGELKERTEWVRVTVFNKVLVDLAEKALAKGSQVRVRGRVETRKWQDQAGNTRYSTEVVLAPYGAEMTIISGKKDEPQAETQGETLGEIQGAGQYNDAGFGGVEDEIPF